jgi:hypothetical protein
LYNLGFRPAVAASTDFHIDQGRQPIGAVRTYVRSHTLEPSSIAQAYRAGRTFASNGPLLDLRVAGAGPGEEIRLPTPGRLQVKIDAVSLGQLDRVELVINGLVLHSFPAAGRSRFETAAELPAEESLWIAARAFGPEHRHLAAELEGRSLGAGQVAHTSPVYVLVQDRPIRAAQPADAQYFVRWCDAVLAGWPQHVRADPSQARHEALIIERLARAREVFLNLD